MSGSLTFATGDSLTVSLGAATVTAAYTQILVTKWTDPVSGTVNALKAGSDNCNLITDSGGTDLGLWNGTNVRDSTVSIPFAGWAALAVTKAARAQVRLGNRGLDSWGDEWYECQRDRHHELDHRHWHIRRECCRFLRRQVRSG